jgi:murein DD-endopeptidase MepM/ murein hydrolase activator NlpD
MDGMTSKSFTKIFLWAFCITTVGLIHACARQKIVFEKPSSPLERKFKLRGIYHGVEKHQTLYRICKTYGVDIKEVATVNGISDQGQIRVGQRIFIPRAKKVLKVDIVIDDVVAEPDEEAGKRAAHKKIDLIWPVKGKCVDFFEENEKRRHQGIDIACPLGTPIKASSGGKVIYSGNTIRGYGNLIILRHSWEYVSVYAHNQANLVKEGSWVDRGQLIGRVGRTGNASGPHLHFEIRRNNTAVNPLDFLK